MAHPLIIFCGWLPYPQINETVLISLAVEQKIVLSYISLDAADRALDGLRFFPQGLET